MDYADVVNRVAQYIDKHFSEKITGEDLSKVSKISKFHFCKIFLLCTGETVGEFLWRYRLQHAYKILRKNKGEGILDVALSVGYESHSSFSRAFKKCFGLSPSNIMQTRVLFQKKIALQKREDIGKDSLAPDFKYLPQFKCYGLRATGYSNRSFIQSAKPTFERLFQILAQGQAPLDKYELIGFPLDNISLTEHEKCQFFAAIKTSTNLSALTLKEIHFREGTWAVFEHRGSYDSLWQTWNKIYQAWVIGKGIALRDELAFEYYLTLPHVPDAEKITKIYFPIVAS